MMEISILINKFNKLIRVYESASFYGEFYGDNLGFQIFKNPDCFSIFFYFFLFLFIILARRNARDAEIRQPTSGGAMACSAIRGFIRF